MAANCQLLSEEGRRQLRFAAVVTTADIEERS